MARRFLHETHNLVRQCSRFNRRSGEVSMRLAVTSILAQQLAQQRPAHSSRFRSQWVPIREEIEPPASLEARRRQEEVRSNRRPASYHCLLRRIHFRHAAPRFDRTVLMGARGEPSGGSLLPPRQTWREFWDGSAVTKFSPPPPLRACHARGVASVPPWFILVITPTPTSPGAAETRTSS